MKFNKKEAVYTKHLKTKLQDREIPSDYPEIIYKNPEKEFYDVKEKRNISIKTLKYNNKKRKLMIAYDDKKEHVEIVTIHPISPRQINNRLKKQRWIEK